MAEYKYTPPEEPVSDCCGADMLGSDEDPICSECKEHCEAFEIDPDNY